MNFWCQGHNSLIAPPWLSKSHSRAFAFLSAVLVACPALLLTKLTLSKWNDVPRWEACLELGCTRVKCTKEPVRWGWDVCAKGSVCVHHYRFWTHKKKPWQISGHFNSKIRWVFESRWWHLKGGWSWWVLSQVATFFFPERKVPDHWVNSFRKVVFIREKTLD